MFVDSPCDVLRSFAFLQFEKSLSFPLLLLWTKLEQALLQFLGSLEYERRLYLDKLALLTKICLQIGAVENEKTISLDQFLLFVLNFQVYLVEIHLVHVLLLSDPVRMLVGSVIGVARDNILKLLVNEAATTPADLRTHPAGALAGYFQVNRISQSDVIDS